MPRKTTRMMIGELEAAVANKDILMEEAGDFQKFLEEESTLLDLDTAFSPTLTAPDGWRPATTLSGFVTGLITQDIGDGFKMLKQHILTPLSDRQSHID